MKKIKIGTRGSKLALIQAEKVKTGLQKHFPQVACEIIPIKTQGDKDQQTPLSGLKEQDFFTREIEEALLNKEIDLAVHSLKDLPTRQPEGLEIAAVLKRDSLEDVLISKNHPKLDSLPSNAKIFTSSLRRKCQLLYFYHGFKIFDIRGNIDTRIKTFLESDYDGLVLAKAGLERLGLLNQIAETIPVEQLYPAPGQGAIAVEIRENDKDIEKIVDSINDYQSFQTTLAERSFLNVLQAGCEVPVGALAEIENSTLKLKARMVSLDAKKMIEGNKTGKIEEAPKIGTELAKELLSKGGDEILKEVKKINFNLVSKL